MLNNSNYQERQMETSKLSPHTIRMTAAKEREKEVTISCLLGLYGFYELTEDT
jgi:hypothetical protein